MSFDLQHALDIVIKKLQTWLDSLAALFPNIIVAIAIVVLFYFIGKGFRNLGKRVLARFIAQKAIVNLLASLTYFLILSAGFIIALNLLHLNKAVTSLLAGAGIVGLALGFAFQDISANFVSGVIMAVRRPIAVGDIIKTNGYHGHVKDIQLRATIIETFQGLHVIIPNRLIFQNPLTNYTRTHKRRVDLEVGISYGDDLEKVKHLTLETIKKNQYLTDPEEVNMVFMAFGDSSIILRVMFWIEYSPENPKFLEARSEAIMSIKQAFDNNGITIPFPIRTLDFGIKGGRALDTQLEAMQ